jgi:hypothetical protein
MVGQYITTPLKHKCEVLGAAMVLHAKVELYVACDIDQIPVSNTKWSERPSANGMEQVTELLALID